MAIAGRSDEKPSPEHFVAFNGLMWRVVEGQYRISSDRLVGNPGDQPYLEQLVEEVKPDVPEATRHLPKLLATPFRYGFSVESRFRRAKTKLGVLYLSETEDTAVAEKAYWRCKFFSRSPDAITPNTIVPHTSFTVLIDADRTLDLTTPPYDQRRAIWLDPDDYTACQNFAEAARKLLTQAIKYESVRDPAARANLAVFDPAAVDGLSLEMGRSWHFRFEGNKLTAYAAFPSSEHLTYTFKQFGLEDR